MIQISSEFSRRPDNGGFGTEHAPESTVASVISGCISSPVVIGNIKPYAPANGYEAFAGTWGVGTAVETEYGKHQLGVGSLASSIAHLLRVPTPTPNNPSLLKDTAGGFVSAVEKSREES